MLAILDDDVFEKGLRRIYDLDETEIIEEWASLTLMASRGGEGQA